MRKDSKDKVNCSPNGSTKSYKWVTRYTAVSGKTLDLTDPSKGEVYGFNPTFCGEDVDLAVAAAKAAFDNWKNTPAEKEGNV